MFILGSGAHVGIGAVVVPSPAARCMCAEEMRAELGRAARTLGLRSFEVPVAVVLELSDEGFSLAAGLRTRSGKKRRMALHARYAASVEEVLASLGEPSPSTATCVFPLVPSLVEDVLRAAPHVPPGLISRDLGLVHLGGNSLCASRLSEALRSRHGVELAVPWLLKSTLAQVEQRIAGCPLAGSPSADVVCKDDAFFRDLAAGPAAMDLTEEALVAWEAALPDVELADNSAVSDVLLTGGGRGGGGSGLTHIRKWRTT